MMGGMSLLMSVKRNRKDCRLKRALLIVNVMMVADAVLFETCAESCDAGMANIDACIMDIMPFVVHRVTWEAWPDRQGRYSVCPPMSWGGGRRECSPIDWWTQENMLASRCADEGAPIYVCSSDILRRAKDETLSATK